MFSQIAYCVYFWERPLSLVCLYKADPINCFVWLCVTNKGVGDVNLAAISQLVPPITEEELASRGYPTDPNVGKEQKIIVRPGITIRCTRNIDKERGFVNGAIAVVHDVLVDYDPSDGQRTCIFIAKLSTGGMILVHIVSVGGAEAMHEFHLHIWLRDYN